MAKTSATRVIERSLWNHTNKMGTFGCFEVSIGFNGDYRGAVERVDYITYNTKGEFSCYEIKVSKADFLSKSAHSFLGHFNYYVMPVALYEQLNEENLLRWDIGVYVWAGGNTLVSQRKTKKKQVSIGMAATLLESMVRSLYRETSKFYQVKPYWE